MTATRPEAGAADRSRCANCSEVFGLRGNGEPARFCAACGQEAEVRPPTLREFAQQFGGAYFSTEGALWRTLKLLLTKPGELSVQYRAGRRKQYVLPLRLYLTVSLLALLVMRSVATVDITLRPEDTERIARENGDFHIDIAGGRAGMKDRVFFCEQLPAWICKRVQRRVDVDPKAMGAEIAGLKERFLGHLGGALFVLLPSFALGLKAVYLNRGLRYTEHLVFALHTHTFWFLALALMLTGSSLLTFVAMVAVPSYTLLALQRYYGGRWWPRVLRALLVATLYAVMLAFAMAGVGLWALLS